MLRLLSALIAMSFLIPAAHAADDGGFGSQRFSSQAPSALDDDTNPAAIEPAAGDEDAQTPDDDEAPQAQDQAEPADDDEDGAAE